MAIASWGLLTLQDAKDHLSVDGNEFDAVIESLVESATLLCEGADPGCDRPLASRSFTEVYDGYGCLSLHLRQFPVTAITTVEFWNGSDWDPQTTSTPYVVQPVKDTIAYRDLVFPWGIQNVRVTYTAGLSSIPKALKDACRIALKALWDVRDKQNAGIASQSFPGGQTVVYDTSALPEAFGVLLAPYRRCAWV